MARIALGPSEHYHSEPVKLEDVTKMDPSEAPTQANAPPGLAGIPQGLPTLPVRVIPSHVFSHKNRKLPPLEWYLTRLRRQGTVKTN